ncbi:MobA/MobL family protein [Psychrobacter celer]
MAIARLSVGIGKKGKASPHAQYIAREGKYEKGNDSLEKLEHTGHGNMPAWAEHNPNYFWQSADEHERKNGSAYREHVVALPRELDSDQRHNLIKDWIEQEIGDKHAYQYAIHNPPAMDGKEQPHAHIMFSERTRDGIERDPDQYFKRYNGKNPERGGAKKANTGMKPADRKADLLAQRDRWEKTCNAHLEQAGRYERISMKSLKAQGIEREPTNFTMTQLKKPEVKDTYKSLLEAKEQDYQAKLDIIRALEGTALTEINRQLRKKEEKAQKQKERKRTQKPLEPQKAPQATNTIPKAPKPQIEPIKATNTPIIEGQTVKEALEVQQSFDKMVAQTAERIRAKRLEPHKADMTRLEDKYKALQDNNSWFGSGKREKQKKALAIEYKRVKRDFNAIKERDFTMDAKKHIEHTSPKAHATHEQARETLSYHASFRYGATQAQAGRQYTGEITAVNRFGVMQKTPTGKKIYHDLDSFKTLPNVGDKVTAIYNKECKAELVPADKAELTRQTQQAELERQQNKDIELDR